MLTRLSLAVVASITLSVGRPAGASPITYAFTGTLDALINGSDQFSGSFTIDGDPKPPSYSQSTLPLGSVNESGSDVSMIVKIGGQEFNIANQSNPGTYVSFKAGLSPSWVEQPFGPPQDEALITAATQGTNPSTSFGIGISFYSSAASNQLDNLRHFNFLSGSSSVFLIGNLGDFSSQSEGKITSIELVPTSAPEPGSLAIFAVLGLAALARRRRRA